MEDWDDYRYFLAVMRNGSYSAAARVLKVSQPTVARHINQLEERLDMRLFDQVANGAKPTPTANSLAVKVEEMERLAKNLKSDDLELESHHSGIVTVTATHSLSAYWLAEKIDAFSTQFPNISVRCITSDDKLNMENRDADIALRFGRPDNSDIVGTRIADIETGIYASKAYLQKYGIPASLEELKNHKLVETFEPISNFPQIQELTALASQVPATAITNCSHTYINLGVSGQGLICVPSFAVYANDKFERILATEFAPKLELWLLFHSNLIRSARVRAFIDFVKQEMKKDREKFTPGTLA